jgi:uncharacterized protein YuzE
MVVTVYEPDPLIKFLESPIKVEYDSVSDTLTVTLRQGEVAESDEDKPGVILDYDEAGNLLFIELLDASQRVEEPRSVTFSVNG